MLKKRLYRQALVLNVLLLSGCELTDNAQRDFNRLVHGNPFASASASTRPASGPSQAYAPTPRTATATTTTRSDAQAGDPAKPADDPKTDPQQAAAPTTPSPPVTLMGKSEGQVRAMLGPPSSVEERAPGKTWHYRDGRCSVDVQLYPDVQTRQFGTLAYEVKSDDNSDEGRRDCLARIRSRAQP
jgi:hypothetical protein